jgi:hypothetical protein
LARVNASAANQLPDALGLNVESASCHGDADRLHSSSTPKP